MLKARKYALLYVVHPQTSIICGADFGSTIASDLQQKLMPVLHFSQEQRTTRFFHLIVGGTLPTTTKTLYNKTIHKENKTYTTIDERKSTLED